MFKHPLFMILLLILGLIHPGIADLPIGSEMIGIEASATRLPKPWNGWTRIPLTLGSDMKRCIEGTESDRVILLLDIPRKDRYEQTLWYSWAEKTIIEARAEGISFFQIGRAGSDGDALWLSQVDLYFKDALIPIQQKVKEHGGCVVFAGAPWPADGENVSRWMFEYDMHEAVDILVSSSLDEEELEYLHFYWIATNKCDSLWLDYTRHDFSSAGLWAFPQHLYLLWSLQKLNLSESPAIFFPPRTALVKDDQRKILELACQILDGPLSYCQTNLFLHPTGRTCAIMVGQTQVVAVKVESRFPVTVSVPPCQNIVFTDVLGFSMQDASDLILRKNQRGRLLAATSIEPPQEGLYLQYLSF